jgi:hypothetical protein
MAYLTREAPTIVQYRGHCYSLIAIIEGTGDNGEHHRHAVRLRDDTNDTEFEVVLDEEIITLSSAQTSRFAAVIRRLRNRAIEQVCQ